MGKNKGYKSMISAIVCFIFMAAGAVCIFLAARTTLTYRFSGKKTVAVVTASMKGGRFRSVEAMYYDENNRPHFCETVYNGIATVGDEFEAYIHPDDPNKLLRMPKTWLIVLFLLLFGSMFIGGLIGLILSVRTHHRITSLSKSGTTVQAEVIMINRRGDFVYDCVMNFVDLDGETQTQTVTFTKTIPAAGEKYPVVYIKTNKGKVFCELIEL